MRFLLAVLIAALATTVAHAERYASTTASGKQVVAHTRLAPVVVHRVFPPYGLGKHVYEPRANNSRESVMRPGPNQSSAAQ